MQVYLGPLGDLRLVPSFPELAITPEREINVFKALSGKKILQASPRAHRTWEWELPYTDATEAEWLNELSGLGVVGPYYLYTSAAAVENLAPQQLQVGGSGAVAGRRILTTGDSGVTQSRVIPVKPSTAYTLSTITNGTGTLTRRLINAAGTQLSTAALAAGTSGTRVSVNFTTTADTAGITLTPTPGIGQIRLTEGTHTGFMPGDGAPEVYVSPLERTAQIVQSGTVLSAFRARVEEVG